MRYEVPTLGRKFAEARKRVISPLLFLFPPCMEVRESEQSPHLGLHGPAASARPLSRPMWGRAHQSEVFSGPQMGEYKSSSPGLLVICCLCCSSFKRQEAFGTDITKEEWKQNPQILHCQTAQAMQQATQLQTSRRFGDSSL